MIIDLSKYATNAGGGYLKLSIPKGTKATQHNCAIVIHDFRTPQNYAKDFIVIETRTIELADELFRLIDLASSYTEYEIKQLFPELFI